MLPHQDGAGVRQDARGAFDQTGFDRFYRLEAARLRQFLKRKIWAEEDRNDLVQEAFVRLVASRSEAARENPGAYLQGIVRNLLVDRVRAWAKSRAIQHFDSEYPKEPATPDVAAELTDMRERYRKALDALPPKTKEVYLLHRVEELGYRQISEQLGISIRTVEWHMAQAIVRITKSVSAHV